MSAAWIVFVLIIGRVTMTGAQSAERLSAGRGRPRRVAWLAALCVTAFWPGVAIIVRALSHSELAARWGIGGPQHLPMIVLRVPRAMVPLWIELTLLILWASVSTILLARLVLFAHRTRRWRERLPTTVVDGVCVRLSRDMGPAVVGLRAMDIVIPAFVLSFEPSMRRFVLRHEVEHRDARDIRLLWIAALLTAIMPWNPFLWLQSNRLRLAIELDCDERVLRADPRPTAYARLLLYMAQHASGDGLMSRLAPAIAAGVTRLEHRIAAISGASQVDAPRSRALHIMVLTGTILLVLAIQAPSMPRSWTHVPPAPFTAMSARLPQRR